VKIRFESTIEDVIAFNRYHFTHSPTWRRQMWMLSLLLPVVLALLVVLMIMAAARANPDDQLPMLVSAFCVASLFPVLTGGWIFFIRWHLTSSLARNTRKFLAEGSNRIMIGWREMELVNGRLAVHTELLDSNLDLRAIQKIVSDGNYTYVYTASISAHLIPMDAEPAADIRAFVAELTEAWENRGLPPVRDEAAGGSEVDVRIVRY
jgi:hypothetical protein